MDYKERRQDRIDKYKGLANKAASESEELSRQAHEMADVIPLGQPILRGHHSERGDRNYREKISRKFDKAHEAYKKIEYYQEKAKASENNTAISSDDPEAIQLLKKKTLSLEAERDKMKRYNAGMRALLSKPYLKAEDFKDPDMYEFLVAYRDKEKPSYMGVMPYPAYELTNIGATIREAKKRLERLQKQAASPCQDFEINGVKIVADPNGLNRVQLHFPGKPSPETISRLKHSGFHWTPSLSCWQRYYSAAAIRLAKEIAEKVDIS